ncbi:putative integral membrane protein, MMPL family [Gordonia polyisoprenivorans VH2]|uniref:Putative integral membrane protein, MMPL family n=1 Tax=Gordonia polyisoprenivorans (strain DSM 44266 / VH2) TaxID=1112204 RepID=H6MV37_GORPV|nr:MMPL family transporter [Gordonia polyisoprenivorans]AFA71624.1 putative integral membrane protein, MMPL family [Gordonia polyisoprenivorans VH2]
MASSEMPDSRPPRRSFLRWLIPALLILVWLIIGGGLGPFAGKLASVSTNDNTAFLPASAESTQVNDQLSRFQDTTEIPAIVIAVRDSGITAADRAYLTEQTQRLQGKEGFASAFSPVIGSKDGKAAEVFIPISTKGEPADTVKTLRDSLANPPNGLEVKVTGPAGQVADLGEAFAGIDGLLLLVAGAVVVLILVVVYRSPILPFVVLISAVFALGLASGTVYFAADQGWLELNGQSQGILFILVFGAATDYALLLVSRFREELMHTADKYTALRRAWRATIEPVSASAGTVILGVLCLLFSDLNSNRSLGPVAALGIVASFLASMTFLPAALALLGRAAFWPLRPHLVETPDPDTKTDAESNSATSADFDDATSNTHRFWYAIAQWVAARPRTVWIATLILLVIGASFAPMFKADGIAQTDFFLGDVDSVAGAQLQAQHFDAGAGTPTWILTRADRADEVVAATRGVDGVAQVSVLSSNGAPVVRDGEVAVQATLSDNAESLAAQDTVERIRTKVHAIEGADAKVGGTTAVDLDTRTTAIHDRNLIIPIVLIVVLAVLILLLRSILAPVLLLATTVLSFATTLGVSALLFNGPFGFPGADPVVPLFAFVFLVALGIDYNIFLMTRVREESIRHGTRAGIIRGLTSTGGVITSAGVVLAATFAALAVIPLLFLAQVAFLVAFGVLVDTLIVRTLLVPALSLDIGSRIWWPSSLSHKRSEPDEDSGDPVTTGTRASEGNVS